MSIMQFVSSSPYCYPVSVEQGNVTEVAGKLCCILDETQKQVVMITEFEPLCCYALQFWVCATDQAKKFKVEITDGTTRSFTHYSVDPGNECLKVLFFTARTTPSHTIIFRMTDTNIGKLVIERVFIEKMITSIGADCLINVKNVETGEEITVTARDIDPAIHQVYHSTINTYDDLVEKQLMRNGDASSRYIKICHPTGSDAYNLIVRRNYPIMVDNTPSHVNTVESWNDFRGSV